MRNEPNSKIKCTIKVKYLKYVKSVLNVRFPVGMTTNKSIHQLSKYFVKIFNT